jgi:23S rRNA pseudouridine1911/1915/1917 synthase
MLNEKTLTKTLTCEKPEHVGTRLDKFLFIHEPEYSRTYFQELIDKGFVKVSGKEITKSSYTLKNGDIVTYTHPPVKEFKLEPQPVDFEIIDEQPDFIVINKPAGLIVHPSESSKDEISLIHGLLYKFKEFSQFEQSERPGIVHRLDRDTSGLLLVARNIPAQIKLVNMFKERHISKKYLALVFGNPPKKGTIDTPIGRHPFYTHKMAPLGVNRKQAISHYTVLEYYKHYALLEVKIVTGRTHQIRVHCESIGYPIVGDITYGKSSELIGRQALHSWKLAFEFKGEKFSYTCSIPKDIQNAIDIAKKETRSQHFKQ